VRLALLLLAACSPSKGKEPSCATRVANHEQWHATLVREGNPMYVARSKLVEVAKWAEQQPMWPSIELTAEDIVMQGRVLATHDGLTPDALRDAFSDQSELMIIVDERVPWRSVRAVGRAALMAGVKRVRFLARGTTKIAEPPPSWIDKQLKLPSPTAIPPPPDPSRRRLFQSCPPAQKLFDDLDERATRDGTPKSDILVRELPNALLACECSEDVNAVERWLWASWNRDEPNMPHTSIEVTLDADAPKSGIADDEPWSKAHAVLAPKMSF
jgi:hypothetical protein